MQKLMLLLLVCWLNAAGAQADSLPPGGVIAHVDKLTGKYIGSPSICILPNGHYIASHDEFGPKSSEYQSAVTRIYSSADKGLSWQPVSVINGQFWSGLFVHRGALYIMGTNKHHGNVVIRRSDDEGHTWTNPYDARHGLILEGEYHTAPVPVLMHNGRIWRAVEYATAKSLRWGERYSALMLSAPVHADLLNAKNWTRSNHLGFDSSRLNGNFSAWLEGNAVATKDGKVVDILRVHAPKLKEEYTAIVDMSKDGKQARFDYDNFFKMPGASKKFTIRYDERTKKYWSIVNEARDSSIAVQKDKVRNTVALVSSNDLKHWTVNQVLLQHPDHLKHGFQYIDWQFEGNDIIYVSRTAYYNANNYHDANYLTFHRVKNFRVLR